MILPIEQVNPQKQKQVCVFWGWGVRGIVSGYFINAGFVWGRCHVLKLDRDGWLHEIVNVVSATEFSFKIIYIM